MTTRTVLAIGLDPAFADLSGHPELSVELVRAFLDQQINRIRDFGHQVDSCLVDNGATAEATVMAALNARAYDCIVIGAGIREPAENLLLFEKIINLIHERAPHSRIAFNWNPTDTAEAAQRWIG
ncbi:MULTISPECIES: hypothetical protein [unclassified Bradyrhizobium]|uniref:hypothetical protein n=1 Tax=Bradyrhizobium sp. USDA 4541 TaxID=2817704 RepID=UPI0020A42756|nr:hypothetical protein [Bradyrhizobium sp. USDA 4541]MCP1848167.1 hypothetical protein [Bradyrhizobium sp. USDA 4541]